ncbi:GTP-binding protein Mx [Acrasis kona]|uniref:GTP-binding protein Mx n=1 Tax=Acrasis kona TaxID=1008807 RepID=A0AAW2Z615_9EUKA
MKTLQESEYNERSHQLITVVNKMRDAGAQFDLDIPTIVFCGNQSAGKSSLIEAISSINVPRSEGTCTRCPMEVRLTQADPNSDEQEDKWSAKVTLRLEYDDTTKTQGRLSQPKEVPFGSVYEKKEVEGILRRAQKAVLNPSKEAITYLSISDQDLTAIPDELKFTRNIVCIHITGAKVNLTLIDLPGIIRTTETREEEIFIKMVRDTVEEYISKKNSIIIATISCKDEIQNQEIFNMAKNTDKQGDRTIGILTKPDTVAEQEEKEWVNIMCGKHFPLRLGYYMVKNPSLKSLKENISFEMARQEEINFFEESLVWKQYTEKLSDRFGVDNLRSALSRKLIEMIETTLPKMQQTIEDKLKRTKIELSGMPEEIKMDHKVGLLHLVKLYSQKIREMVLVENGNTKVFDSINRTLNLFVNQITSTQPSLSLEKEVHLGSKPPPRPSSNNNSSSPISFIFGNNESQNVAASNPFLKPIDTQFQTPGRQSLNSSSDHQPFQIKSVVFSREQLKRDIENQRGKDLPGFVHFGPTKHIIKKCQKEWGQIAMSLLTKIYTKIEEVIVDQSNEDFNRFLHLRDQVNFHVRNYARELLEKNRNIIDYLVDAELSEPLTLNNHYFSESVDKYMLEYKKPFVVGNAENALKLLHNAGFHDIKIEDLDRLRRDPDEEIHKVIASARAYHRVSRKSFTDSIQKCIFCHFLKKFADTIDEVLIEKLNILDGDKENFAKLLAEDKLLVTRRGDLKEQESRLERVYQETMHFV